MVLASGRARGGPNLFGARICFAPPTATWLIGCGMIEPMSERSNLVDASTVDYFDSHPHHYSHQRIKGVASMISHRVTRESTLCDVGAGGGKPSRA